MAPRKRKITKKASTKGIKCVWSGRLVVPAEQTPSGTRYLFEPGQSQQVNILDYEFLLSKKKDGAAGCCGNSGTPIKYFEEI